jgi:hypothetical protein
MAWHVRFTRPDGIAEIARLPTRERAIEEAARLLEAGCDVLDLGAAPPIDAIDFPLRPPPVPGRDRR